MSANGIEIFNRRVSDIFENQTKYLFQRPSYLPTFSKIVTNIRRQTENRNRQTAEHNLTVPPLLIVSVTNDCNLSCKGCYACAQHRNPSEEISLSTIDRIVREATELGVSVIMFAGGEPLIKDGILDIPRQHPETLFSLFTNGLLFDDNIISRLKRDKNIIPIISIEGDQVRTDNRRGTGVYHQISQVMKKLSSNKILWGTSITLTSENYDEIIHSGFLEYLQNMGARATFLIEYVPSDSMDDVSSCLTEDRKQELRAIEDQLLQQYKMMIVPLPGNEDLFGGCMAAGRGFLHISSTGAVEACPFAPYSDLNIKDISLREALQSRLLEEIRSQHHLLKESKGGCALKENKEWVGSLLETNI